MGGIAVPPDIFGCLVNGELSAQFRVSRGVRQGCPLSPLLYVAMAETIACAVRNNPQIAGYPLPRTRRAKICQYADDTTIVVLSDASLKEVFSLFQRYELASGARLNVTKSHGLLIGSWKGRTDLPVHLDWSSSHITVMGSRLSNDGTESWDKSVRSLESMLASWSSRSLSYHGRALIANTLGLSRFWYLSSIACLPSTILQAINTRIFSFIWNQKREWLARSSITQRSSQGGLSLIDVQRKVLSLYIDLARHHLPTAAPPTKQEILLGFPRDSKFPPVFQCLLSIVRQELWKTRNAARWDKTVPSIPEVTSKIKSSLRFTIKTQQRHCGADSFSELWLGNDLIGTILEDGSIQFTKVSTSFHLPN